MLAMTTLLENIEGLLLRGKFGIILHRRRLAAVVILKNIGEDRHPCLTGTVIHLLHRPMSEDVTHQIHFVVMVASHPSHPLRPTIDMSDGPMNGTPPILLRMRAGLELHL